MTALIHLTEARKELAQAKTFSQAKAVRDKAQAARDYLASINASLEAQNDCAEIKLEAERKLGSILEETVRQGRPEKGSIVKPFLPDDVSKTQSHRLQTMASLPLDVFQTHVAKVKEARRELTSAGVYKLAKQKKAQSEVIDAPAATNESNVVRHLSELDGKKFSCIYADPPWAYGNQGTRAATDNHYQTMAVDDIAALPIADLAADDAHLHLWTTNAFLFEAKRIIEAWGFEYRSVMLWVKPQLGIGNYWRVSHEFLLFGIRGKAPFRDRGQRSWISANRIGHSRKPELFREAIQKVSPGPFLELFGRRQVVGWTVWGNQIGDEVIDPVDSGLRLFA